MKRLSILIAIMILLFTAIGYSADTTGTITAETTAICLDNNGYIVPCDGVPTYQPKYELTFTIRYNKIPADKIRDLIYKIMIEHKDACGVDVKIKKPDSGVLTSD